MVGDEGTFLLMDEAVSAGIPVGIVRDGDSWLSCSV
jgi:predicted type IV restriction endonuclease